MDKLTSCSSSASASLQASTDMSPSSCPPDDISVFLHQILLRSSSSSANAHTDENPSSTSSSSPFILSKLVCNAKALTLTDDPQPSFPSALLLEGISVVDSSNEAPDLSGAPMRLPAVKACSPSFGASENERDEYNDGEIEEDVEALVDEVLTKPVRRSSSKRSRAAEVHNLSEKRRRSRINEKLKALQNLIPNSNKTDKASMLDEAIEYLKQLQLQVQMLSMKNGLSLHPICLPGSLENIQLPQMRVNFGEENDRSRQVNYRETFPSDQTPASFTLPNQYTVTNQPAVLDIHRINSSTSFGLESSIWSHVARFPLHTSAQEICREEIVQPHQTTVNRSRANEIEIEMGRAATMSLPFDIPAPNLGTNKPESFLLKTSDHDPTVVLPSYLNRMTTGGGAS